MAQIPPPPPPPPPPIDVDDLEEERPRPWLRVVALVLALVLLLSFGVDFMLDNFASEQGGEDQSGAGKANAPHDRCLAENVPLFPEPNSLEQQIERTKKQVEALRALEFEGEVDARVVTSAQLGRRVTRSLSAYSDRRAERDQRILATLGIVNENIDLREVVEDTLRGQVAGLYLPKSKRLLVASEQGSKPLSPGNATVLAHEIQHALADQRFGFPTSEKIPRGKEDEVLAHRSLIEGDATVTQRRFAQRALTPEQQADILQDPSVQESLRDYYALPPYFRKAFEFPYVAGANFVEALCAEGGWELVNEAQEDPPVTSAEIIYPERFLAREEPRDPPELGAPGRGWDEGYEVSFGAADLLLMFELPGGSEGRALDDPRDAAAAWAGGALTLWTRGQQNAIGIALAQQSTGDLCPSLAAWYLASFPGSDTQSSGKGRFTFEGDGRSGAIRCQGSEVKMAIAPDVGTARAVLGTS
ncbi:MAG: hypothetical protein ACR2KQ_08415 [Actinomycetota bacterium]